MSTKECCNDETCTCECCDTKGVSVKVNVDVPKIVKYACLTGVLIVGIIFGTKLFSKMVENGFIDNLRK